MSCMKQSSTMYLSSTKKKAKKDNLIGTYCNSMFNYEFTFFVK